MKRFGLLLLLIFGSVNAKERGILLPCNDTYLNYAVHNLQILRGKHDCRLPIEIWHSGDELSLASKKILEAFAPITFRDIAAITHEDPKKFRGWQIKGFAVGYTYFDEIILIDADLILFQNVEILFDHPGYIRTGAFLFRDQNWSLQGGLIKKACVRRFDDPYYFKRREFINSLIKRPSPYLPKEWSHYWDLHLLPTKDIYLSLDEVESGCVVIDRERHKRGVQKIVDLNKDYKNTYKYFWGDKETFWVAFESEKEPYTVNEEFPKTYFAKSFDSSIRTDIVQFIDGVPFYQQKKLIKPIEDPQFIDINFKTHPTEITNFTGHYRYLTREEIEQIYELHFLSHMDTE